MERIDNGKATIRRTMDGISMIIPSKKNWFFLIFGSIWLIGWYWGLRMVSMELLPKTFNWEDLSGPDQFPSVFTIVWTLLWTLGGLFTISMILWGFLGKEEIHLKGSDLTLRKHILRMGTNKVFDRDHITNIRFDRADSARFYSRDVFKAMGITTGKVQFDYGMKTYKFALGLDDAEARYIVELLFQEIEAQRA